MTAILIIVAAIVLLLIGYVGYGSWLAKQWGIDPKKSTPAVEMEDGVDYVAAKPAVLMGHHFSSIAGAGPINGPIQAAVFGWVPVFLWCIIGGIFFGGLQDFGSLFASLRHNGKSVGEIIRDSMGKRAQKLFTIFALLVLILVIASFVNVVAGTFMSDGGFGVSTAPTGNQTTAMISLLFIVLAIIYGYITNRMSVGTLPATIGGIIGIVAIVILGLNFGFVMSRTAWIVTIGIYIAVASLVPVWILLQPRDYLSSFLLYGMMLLALVGIFVAAATGRSNFNIPAFTGWNTSIGTLFPALFITVACGACSGFHSLIATGTSSKQLDNEKHAKPIAYGSMLIESALGIVALIALGMVYDKYTGGAFGGPPAAFAAGVATMFSDENSGTYNTIYALLTLAVSVFALTSLDTGTRLGRFLFSELFLRENEKSWKDATGVRRFLAHPMVGTTFLVVIGCILGGLSLSQIWGLFGAANQLLAGIALMAVCAWLGQAGKNNKMFYVPMVFMLAATLSSLFITVKKKLVMISAGEALWGDWFQLLFAAAMAILAIFLVVEGIQTFKKQKALKKA
ncbi:carbon starvation CstA family protein [Fusicatenibacter faecihominis]|uniref:Carbon starvation protein A n=1 Tax=Fusicatenibacter faecihominis TaxID=2881276 RepID=A0AAE3J7C2_9FIRM|nr:carbon starvation protein A [Fusicatenibacter faecihominis]MCC2190275.1 carbon starvation protein A [Fusicatenibacter faecihominis]